MLCREHGLGSATQALAKITVSAKVMQVVLPVFFGKADACIVTRNGFEIIRELNPQLEKQLRIIAVSPPVVPALTCFRRGLSEALKKRIIDASQSSSTQTAYHQLMVPFESDSVCDHPLSVLDGTRNSMAEYQGLGGRTADAARGSRDTSAAAEQETPK